MEECHKSSLVRGGKRPKQSERNIMRVSKPGHTSRMCLAQEVWSRAPTQKTLQSWICANRVHFCVFIKAKIQNNEVSVPKFAISTPPQNNWCTRGGICTHARAEVSESTDNSQPSSVRTIPNSQRSHQYSRACNTSSQHAQSSVKPVGVHHSSSLAPHVPCAHTTIKSR